MCCYGMSREAQDEIKKHYAKYHDWTRIKDIITVALIDQARQLRDAKLRIKRLKQEKEDLLQGDIGDIFKIAHEKPKAR